MSEVHRVTVQLEAPSGDYPGKVTYGYYTVADGLLTMTDGEGNAVRQPATGDTFTVRLRDGVQPEAIARSLTRRVWRALHGEDGAGFNRPLNYQRIAVA